MKKPNGYEQAQAFTGDYESLKPGGYICIIKGVMVEDKPYGQLMRVMFDIAEGESKGFYQRKYDKAKESNPDTKWQGMYYQTIKEGDDLKYFKGFITCIENSNNGFKFDFDEKKLKGKLFGAVFGEEEYINNNGELKLSTKCRFVRSVEQIRKGIEPPEVKRLNGNNGNGGSYSSDVFPDEDIPF